MRLVLGITLLWVTVATAETVDTNCYRYGNRMSCQTNTTPQPQVERPNALDNFLKGREARLRHDQMQLQNELLQQQIDASKRAEFEQDEARRSEAAVRARARWEQIRRQSESNGDEEAALDYWRQQVSACARIERKHPEREAEDCVDNLLVTDPEFARAHAVAQRNRLELSEAVTESVTEVRRDREALAPIESSNTCTPARIRLGSCRVARE
jgi:hypothetical protein